MGEGWRLYTREEHAAVVERYLVDGQRSRLTQAALETLAVIAYRQPVTRARVSAIRGVGVDGVMRTLLARGLVHEVGTDPDSGGGLYATTPLFLERLGLTGLDELPELAPLLPETVVDARRAPRRLTGRGTAGPARRQERRDDGGQRAGWSQSRRWPASGTRSTRAGDGRTRTAARRPRTVTAAADDQGGRGDHTDVGRRWDAMSPASVAARRPPEPEGVVDHESRYQDGSRPTPAKPA